MLNASLPNTSPTSQFSSQPPFSLSLFLESMLICAVLQGYADFFAPLFYMGGYEAKVRKKRRKVHFFLYPPSKMQS